LFEPKQQDLLIQRQEELPGYRRNFGYSLVATVIFGLIAFTASNVWVRVPVFILAAGCALAAVIYGCSYGANLLSIHELKAESKRDDRQFEALLKKERKD
jgi:hypothetical protein